MGNNPLSYNDPSGHFLKDLVVRAVLSTVMGPIAGAMVSGYISSGGNLKATLLAGANAFTSNVIGKEFGHNLSFNKGEIGKLIGRSFAHGIAQGALSQAGGGRFSDGFIGGFAGSITQPLGSIVEDRAGTLVAVVTTATIGGTVSKISGGSFENGATSASFVALYNWASRFGFRIHQRAIDQTLSDELSAEDRVILKDAQVSADEKRSGADAHLHAQSNADDKQTPEQARAHINAQMRKAFAAAQDKLDLGESCDACHGDGKSYSVDEMHAR